MKTKISEIQELLGKARYYHNIMYEEDKAIELCNKAIELCNKAIELCNKALKIEPENKDAMLIKAGSLDCLGKEKEAYELIQKIIEKWPANWEAYYLMGMLLFNTNEKMAIENINKSIKLNNNFNNVIAAAQLLYFLEEKKYNEYLKEAKRLAPKRFEKYMEDYWEWEII